MLALNWPLVFTTTILLYALTIIFLPFNTIYATVFLFTLIAFWSRLPGVGIVHPLFIIYNTDLVDLFALILTINLGPAAGIALIIAGNLWPRVCGIHPPWGAVITDTVSMSIVALFLPWINTLVKQDIFMTMILFTLIRAILWHPLDLIFWPQEWANIWHKISVILIGTPMIFVINGFYAKVFGNFFNNLLHNGVSFSWPLFLFATAAIIVFYLCVFGKSKSASNLDYFNKIAKSILKRTLKSDNKATSVQIRDEFEEIREIEKVI